MAGVQLAGMKEQVPALRMTGLHKAFRETVAVDHVDLTVPSGSFFGLVGPNGAGKTTALLMAVGLLRPDAGRSEVLGVDVQADPMRARQLMGVLPDGLAMPERLSGRELLTLIGEMRGLDPDVIAQRAQDLLEVMGLTGAERTLIVDYSTGMRKKIGLATALLHAPRLLVLDGPFEAVDLGDLRRGRAGYVVPTRQESLAHPLLPDGPYLADRDDRRLCSIRPRPVVVRVPATRRTKPQGGPGPLERDRSPGRYCTTTPPAARRTNGPSRKCAALIHPGYHFMSTR
jgi:ABC-type Na+ transport system ATPase subunit NatA